MADLGVRLQLFIGPTVPLPAPYPVIDAIQELTITNKDRDRDGFQLNLALGKDSLLDYGLILSGYFNPPNRVIVMVLLNARPHILIDGVITNQQIQVSNRPGESTLVVTGDDISLQLDLKEKSTTHPNQPDSIIVTKLLAGYATYGLVPQVTPTTDVPIQIDRIPTQQGTDLAYIRTLAQRNGFVFYIEPTGVPGLNTAYWGLDNRLGVPQPALSLNMGAQTNVDAPLSFTYDALGPTTPEVTIVEPLSKQAIPIPVPSGLRPPLALRPAAPLRSTIPRNTANLSAIQAALRALSSASAGSDAVSASGQLDALRYGNVLRSRRLVGVRGCGLTYDGNYYVREVRHTLRRGSYTQSFTLTREGHGALTPLVLP